MLYSHVHHDRGFDFMMSMMHVANNKRCMVSWLPLLNLTLDGAVQLSSFRRMTSLQLVNLTKTTML